MGNNINHPWLSEPVQKRSSETSKKGWSAKSYKLPSAMRNSDQRLREAELEFEESDPMICVPENGFLPDSGSGLAAFTMSIDGYLVGGLSAWGIDLDELPELGDIL
jgi:hypothetical protein